MAYEQVTGYFKKVKNINYMVYEYRKCIFYTISSAVFKVFVFIKLYLLYLNIFILKCIQFFKTKEQPLHICNCKMLCHQILM